MSKLPKYLKINFIIGFISIILSTSLTIGYSSLSERLDIKTSVLVSQTKDIRINSMSNLNSLEGSYEVNRSSYSKTTFNISIGLINKNSIASFTLSIKNYGTTPMQIKSIRVPAYTNEEINYTIEGIDVASVFLAGEAKNFIVTFKYKENVVNFDQTLDALFELEFTEYISIEKNYITGMNFDLRGVDAPINNIWYDHINKKEMVLTNTIYNKEKKQYDFSQTGAYAITDSILPETGDFTLEAFIKLPSILTSTDDEAIVAQVNDLTNDSGRIKLNLKSKTLIVFLNRQKPSDINVTFSFATDILNNNSYLMQLVRSGEKLILYLNGELVSTNDYLSTNKISPGPFKISRWNEADKQQFKGSVYAVRTYNRALTQEELMNNYEVDQEKYKFIAKNYDNLKSFAVGEQLTASGDGLYLDNVSKFVYRGLNVDNYVKFKNNEDTFRIISYEEDNTMKVVNESLKIAQAFDISGNRDNTSTYCLNAEIIVENGLFYGCNAWNKLENFSNTTTSGTVFNDASLNSYLNATYYGEIVGKINVIKHAFASGTGFSGIGREQQNIESEKSKWHGYIGLLTLADITNASLTSTNITTSQTKMSNYLTALASKTEMLWTMTNTSDNTYDVHVIAPETIVSKRRASRFTQIASSTIYKFYAMPSFYVKSDVSFTGTGTINDPFIID